MSRSGTSVEVVVPWARQPVAIAFCSLSQGARCRLHQNPGGNDVFNVTQWCCCVSIYAGSFKIHCGSGYY